MSPNEQKKKGRGRGFFSIMSRSKLCQKISLPPRSHASPADSRPAISLSVVRNAISRNPRPFPLPQFSNSEGSTIYYLNEVPIVSHRSQKLHAKIAFASFALALPCIAFGQMTAAIFFIIFGAGMAIVMKRC